MLGLHKGRQAERARLEGALELLERLSKVSLACCVSRRMAYELFAKRILIDDESIKFMQNQNQLIDLFNKYIYLLVCKWVN